MVRNKPRMVNIAMMENEYRLAFFIPCALVWLRFKKKLTVTGNIAYRQGCNTEIKPHLKPSIKVPTNVLWTVTVDPAFVACAKMKRTVKLNKPVKNILAPFINGKIKK